jgi:hypothetical protein
MLVLFAGRAAPGAAHAAGGSSAGTGAGRHYWKQRVGCAAAADRHPRAGTNIQHVSPPYLYLFTSSWHIQHLDCSSRKRGGLIVISNLPDCLQLFGQQHRRCPHAGLTSCMCRALPPKLDTSAPRLQRTAACRTPPRQAACWLLSRQAQPVMPVHAAARARRLSSQAARCAAAAATQCWPALPPAHPTPTPAAP